MGAGGTRRRRPRLHDRRQPPARRGQHRRDLRAGAVLVRPRRGGKPSRVRQRLRRPGHGRERHGNGHLRRGLRQSLDPRRKLVLRRMVRPIAGAVPARRDDQVPDGGVPRLCAGRSGGKGESMKAVGLMSAAAMFAVPVGSAFAVTPQHPQGPHWSGNGLEGYRFVSPLPPPLTKPIEGTGPNGKLTLTPVRCEPAGTSKKPSGGSPRAYRCVVTASKKICAGAEGSPAPIVLVEGTWPTPTSWSKADLTASCSVENVEDNEQWKAPFTGSLAKCVEIWGMNTEWKRLTACVHMARAAYDGDASYTFPGTMIDGWDDE